MSTRNHPTHQREVPRRWTQLAALELTPQHVGHYINTERL
jgi:hypothetical protein